MLSTLAAGAIASGPDTGSALHGVTHCTTGAWAAPSQTVLHAGLIDLDATVVLQSAFFIILMLVLPRLVFKPMLARLEQREARTEGARAEAKAMRHAADEQIAAYEQATAEEKRRALDERARTRSAAEKQAAELIAQARAQTVARIDAGIANQKRQVADAQEQLHAEAVILGRQIATKIAEG